MTTPQQAAGDPRSGAATRLSAAVRLTAGAIIAGVLVLGTAGGVAFGWVSHTSPPSAKVVAPNSADSMLTCSGPLLAIGRDANAPAKITEVARDRVTSTGEDQKRSSLKTPGVSGDSGPVRLLTPAQGRTAPGAAGASSASAADEDLAGFAASACAPARMESWLIAGSTMPGSADLILLANPGAVPATVDLTLFGDGGAHQSGGGNDVVVAPGTQRVVPLAGLGLQQAAPIVRVTATGAPVRAVLQSSIVRGLEPGGLDQSGVAAAAAQRQVITGVRVARQAQGDATSIVRLLSPAKDATASVSVIGEHGTTGPALQVPLEAGSPVDAELGSLAPGDYSVIVTADQPVVGAVWQATGTGKGDDFSWVAAGPALPPVKDGTVFSVPGGPSPVLMLVGAGDATSVTVTPVAGGMAQKIAVGPGQTASAQLAAGRSYRLLSDHAVHASVAFAGPDALASFPVWPQDAASAPVRIYP